MSEATPKGILKVAITDFNGDAIAGGGSAVSLADGADVTEGTKADTAWDGVAASATVVAILKKIATSGASAGLTDTQLRATPVPVSGTFWQATQPISAVALPLPTGAATEASLALQQVAGGTALGTLKNQLMGAVATASAPTYVEGTINPLSFTLAGALRVGGTISQGAGSTTANSWTTKLTDGTNGPAAVKAASVAPAATDPALVVAVSPNTPALGVTGTFWQATQPVSGPLTDTQLRATPVPVSGAFFQATQPVSLAASVAVTGPLTDTQIRATALPVSGAFFQATQPVSGTFWQATQPVSGPLTDTQLRATAVPVSGTFFQATQPVSLAASVAVTGTFFQATQPVSIAASVAVTGPLTDTQLRATAVPVSLGTVKAASTLAAATDTALVVTQSPMRADASTLSVTVTAASGAAATLTLPAAAAGLFHYITSIRITKYGGAAASGIATPVLVTTTNIPGALVWTTKTLLGIGDTEQIYETFPTPLKSSVAATATTIVAPIVAGTLWRITATYYTAP